MIDLNEIEINEEDIKELTKEMSIASGFELGAINTVMPDTMKYSRAKYSEFMLSETLANTDGLSEKLNECRFPNMPAPHSRKKYIH